VLKLSRTLNWPILADVASGLRLGSIEENIIPYYDLIFSCDSYRESMQPQTILHFGSEVTSKHVHKWLKQNRPDRYIRIADHSFRHDPDHIITDRFECSITTFVDFLLPFIKENKATAEWTNTLKTTSDKVSDVLHNHLDKSDTLSEPKIARQISQLITPDSFLYVGNSMPIRDMDSFADTDGPVISLGCNRGVSGIDGNIATTVGLSIGYNKRGTVLIGDLAFLHDINSLAILKNSGQPPTIVVINNNGGGIFSFLPIAQRTDIFDTYWGTPHNLSFEHTARQFDLDYHHPETASEFETVYRNAQTNKRSTIIEITTERTENYKLHKNLQQAVADILKTK
jgi:2-succinyl-5-enolpyruvyl-6-hydroxy-3-cyclohexene-1-carboxylate synthase